MKALLNFVMYFHLIVIIHCYETSWKSLFKRQVIYIFGDLMTYVFDQVQYRSKLFAHSQL